MVHVSNHVPPLVAGDRLTRVEFEERYHAMPGLRKAELVDGVVYMPSPVSNAHANAQILLSGWLLNYIAATPGLRGASDGTVRLDEDNEPQPDLALRREGGTSKIDADGYVVGPPELLVEVSLSSRAYDLHQKKEVYRRHGVGTYVVWQLEDRKLRWFELVEGRFIEREPDPDKVHRSEKFPGLWLDVDALTRDDAAGVLATLQRGLASR